MYCAKGKISCATNQNITSQKRRRILLSCKFVHSVNHLFQISKFSSRFKIIILSKINTISKKQLCWHIFIWQHELISLVKLRLKIGKPFLPSILNFRVSPVREKKDIYIYSIYIYHIYTYIYIVYIYIHIHIYIKHFATKMASGKIGKRR